MCSTTFRATSALHKNYNFRKIRFYSKKTLTSSNTENPLSDSATNSSSTDPKQVHAAFRKHLLNGPNLKHFFRSEHLRGQDHLPEADVVPYLQDTKYNGAGRKVYFDVYGCQQNSGDSEIIWSILKASNYTKTETVEEADVVLLITCAIRERAEDKVWNRLEYLKGIRAQRKRKHGAETRIGILGCMAERLKEKVLEIEKSVDVIAGPDSYKDLPRLLAITGNNNTAINVLLSLDETYADVMPVRLNSDSISAFVSIMRGCDNMCTYCIVPFTRGRERSRPILSIRAEVEQLAEQGVREITLLGQNVNSYRDLSLEDRNAAKLGEATKTVPGFKTVYKTKLGGKRFAELLDTVASVNPEIRVKFTSPHPKDFPDELLQVIQSHPNIVKNLHLPAQSGNTAVLERMRRGYTREAYLNLVDNIKSKLPTMTLSSDFICGFCGETDEEFADTMSLVEKVQYNTAYIYPYSMREKTTAHRRYHDTVPASVKRDRVDSLVKLYRHHAECLNRQQIGQLQLVLVEGVSKRSTLYLAGRNDNSVKVIFPQCELEGDDNDNSNNNSGVATVMKPGDYVVVQISTANSQVLKGIPLYRSGVAKFARETRYSDRYLQYSGVI